MEVLVLLLVAVSVCQLSLATQLYCYHDSQAFWRRGSAQFRIRDLEEAMEYCGAVVYGHAVIDPVSYQVKPLDSFLDTDEGHKHYRHVTNLKRPYPSLQVLLSVGSQQDTEHPAKYLAMLESPENRTAFINSARALVRRYNFDGLELAWQFPQVPPPRHVSGILHFWEAVKDVFSGRHKADMQKMKQQRDGFTALVRDLKAALRTDDMVLTAVAYPLVKATSYFDIPELMPHLDAVVLRAFDYNTPERNHSSADLSAPLNSTDTREVPASAVASVKLWMDHGAPADKLILGIPTFGRTWKARNESAGIGAPPVAADGPGDAGPRTRTPGILSYPEICRSNDTCVDKYSTMGSNKTGVHAFCRRSLTWVAYDGPELAALKATYCLGMSLAGVQLVDLSLDDFDGQCGQGSYPILREVHCALHPGDC